MAVSVFRDMIPMPPDHHGGGGGEDAAHNEPPIPAGCGCQNYAGGAQQQVVDAHAYLYFLRRHNNKQDLPDFNYLTDLLKIQMFLNFEYQFIESILLKVGL